MEIRRMLARAGAVLTLLALFNAAALLSLELLLRILSRLT